MLPRGRAVQPVASWILPTETTPVVEVRDVRVEFSVGARRFTALNISRFAAGRNAVLGLSGPSGSGKTTLLNVCAGLLSPTAGMVRVDGIDLCSLSPADRDRVRAERIGYVFQTFNLIPALSALENVLVAMLFGRCIPAAEQRQRAEDLLQKVGLSHRLHHPPSQLSQGEMQRVGIARALANRPRLILADEPTASLEPGLGDAVVTLLIEVARESGATLIVASHDPRVLARLDGVIELSKVNHAARTAA